MNAKILLLLILVIIAAIWFQFTWLAVIAVFAIALIIVVWFLSGSWHLAKFFWSGIKADASREYEQIEKATPKTPDMKIADEFGRKIARSAGEAFDVEPKGETLWGTKSIFAVLGNFSKNLISLGQRILKK